jgi:hypothetical protein
MSERKIDAVPAPESVELIGAPPAAAAGRRLLDDLDIRIDCEGRWYYCGSPIERKELVCLFASALRRDTAGRFWLVTPAEIGAVRVDDAPFIAVETFFGGSGHERIVSFLTNVDNIVTVDQLHPVYVVFDPASGEPRPYVAMDGGMCARLTRTVYYELVETGCEEIVAGRRAYGIWSSGCFFPLGSLDDDR